MAFDNFAADGAVGSRVRVLQGRRFPAFGAGDVGEIRRVDFEAKTCDVIFDNNTAAGILPVSMRHLELVDLATAPAPSTSSTRGAFCTATLAGEAFAALAASAPGDEDSGWRGYCSSSSRSRSPAQRMSAESPVRGRLRSTDTTNMITDDCASIDLKSDRGASPSRPTTPARRRRQQAFGSPLSRYVEGGKDQNSTNAEAWTIGKTVSSPSSSIPTLQGGPLPSGNASIEIPTGDLAVRMAALDTKNLGHEGTLNAFEARLAACEAAVTFAVGYSQSAGRTTSGGSGRLVAARVAALEGAHQAEISDLRRALDDALALGREHAHLHKKYRAAAREAEQVAEKGENRLASLREGVRRLREDLDRLGFELEGQERRAAGMEEAAAAVGAGLTRLGSLLESKERRTADLAQAVAAVDGGVGKLSANVEAHRLRELDAQLESRRGSEFDGSAAGPGRAQDNEPIWQALRELQELVVHESEHRAAGLREVFVVLGQGVEQLRGEQTRHAIEMEGRSRSEQRRAKQRVAESQIRHSEHDRRADVLQQHLDAMSQAIAAERVARLEAVARMEERMLEVRALPSRGLSPPAAEVRSSPTADGEVLASSHLVSPVSFQRLEALEAKYDSSISNTAGETVDLADMCGAARRAACKFPQDPAIYTDATFVKLRNQLVGLQSELISPTADSPEAVNVLPTVAAPVSAGAWVAEDFQPVRQAQVVRCYSAPMVQATPLPSAVPAAATRPANVAMPPSTCRVMTHPPRVVSDGDVQVLRPLTSAVSKAEQQQVTSVPMYFTDQCVCGEFFMLDACFCRKCGAKRPEAQLSSSTALQQSVVSFAVPSQPANSVANTSLMWASDPDPTTRVTSPRAVGGSFAAEETMSATLSSRHQGASDIDKIANCGHTGVGHCRDTLSSQARGVTAIAAEKETPRGQEEIPIGPQVHHRKPKLPTRETPLPTRPAWPSATASLPLTSPASLSSTAVTDDLAEKIRHTKMAVEALETFMSPAP